MRTTIRLTALGATLALATSGVLGAGPADNEIAALRTEIARQQSQLRELQQALARQQDLLERLAAERQTAAAGIAAAPGAQSPAVPAAEHKEAQSPVAAAVASSAKHPAPLPRPAEYGSGAAFAGMRLSGDFRLRADVQARSGNEVAGPLQNVRSRYRMRLNLDRELDERFRLHLQLSTGPYSNGLTNDQDMAGGIAKHPFSISEAWVHYQPNSSIALRGGRMEEVFADNTRFLWDDDVRFNGFQQTVRLTPAENALGVTAVEIRAGEYFLSNPAVYVMKPDSPFAAAGYEPGGKVRDSNLFHPGVIVRGRLGSAWNHQMTADVQLYRNPDQIQLMSTPAGAPVLVNNTLGLALSGPPGGTGNATTTPGGAIYSAPDFHVARLAYRLERRGFQVVGREMPAWVDVQGSRNIAAGSLRDAWMVSANLGSVRQAGDMRFLYQFAVKDANSMISQFTDDDLGTGSGVNIAVHGLRFDLGLTRFLQFQNLLFLQRQRRASEPAQQMFVPLQRGANSTIRYLGQLAFSF
jgi:hypothetical protein